MQLWDHAKKPWYVFYFSAELHYNVHKFEDYCTNDVILEEEHRVHVWAKDKEKSSAFRVEGAEVIMIIAAGHCQKAGQHLFGL